MEHSIENLRSGVVLAELGGYGDGPFCASHGAGAALVMLGTYIVDAGEYVPYPERFVFRPGSHSYAPHLREHVARAKESGAAVGVSIISVDLDETVGFLLASEEAGADYLSVCMHSTMEMFTDVGLGAALLRRDNWPLLRRWVQTILSSVHRPLIVKLGSVHEDADHAVTEMASIGVNAFHVDVPEATSHEGNRLVATFGEQCPFLIVSGGIRTVEDARGVIAAGADAIAVGQAAIDDPDLCGRLQAALRVSA